MGQFCLVLAVAIATFAPTGSAQQVAPYKVLKTARVGGEGGWEPGYELVKRHVVTSGA